MSAHTLAPAGPPKSAARPAGPEGDAWFFRRLGAELGPYRFEELAAFAAAGRLTGDDVVRRRTGRWSKAAAVPGLIPPAPPQADSAAETTADDEYGFLTDLSALEDAESDPPAPVAVPRPVRSKSPGPAVPMLPPRRKSKATDHSSGGQADSLLRRAMAEPEPDGPAAPDPLRQMLICVAAVAVVFSGAGWGIHAFATRVPHRGPLVEAYGQTVELYHLSQRVAGTPAVKTFATEFQRGHAAAAAMLEPFAAEPGAEQVAAALEALRQSVESERQQQPREARAAHDEFHQRMASARVALRIDTGDNREQDNKL